MQRYRVAFYHAFSDNMWEIDVANQAVTFLYSLCLGGLFCAVYDTIRACHKAGLDSFLAVFITDIIFWVVFAFATFVFLIARTNGEIRAYVIFGEMIGFLLFRISFSRILFPALSFVFTKTALISRKANKCLNLFYIKTESLLLKIYKGVVKILKSVKKLLKNRFKLLYTNKNNVKSENVLNEAKTET